MNPLLADAAAPERRAGGRGKQSLYAPASWALVRAPLLPAAAASTPDTVARDPRTQAAVRVASADLAAALERTPVAARARAKLLRYLIRMSTRPTPYGLFAGVGLSGWGDATDLAIGPDEPRTRTRPDMGWLLGLVAAVEQDPEVRGRLRLAASSAVVFRGGRAFAMGGLGAPPSVRATGPMRLALELAREPIEADALAGLLADSAGASREKAERLVGELWQQGFLVSELRPPLTGADATTHVRRRLADIDGAAACASQLEGLQRALAEWDGQPLECRGDAWPVLLDRVRRIHPAGTSDDLLQTDMALPLAGATLSGAVGAEAARAAELLLRLSPYPRGLPQLDAYRRAFQARYGNDRDVPLLELVDPELGLGAPVSRAGGSGMDQQAAARRQQVLRHLALDAHRDRRLVVELDEALLDQLAAWGPTPGGAPPSLDISVFVAAASRAAIDSGDFQVVVGPNLGATGAGRNLGRFADLLGPPARAALEEVAQAEQQLRPGCVIAEVVYMPPRTRSANVAIRPNVHAREIAFDVVPGVPHERAIPVDELVVRLRGGRFEIRLPSEDAEVVGLQGHMLNPMHAPAAARFLMSVAAGARGQLSSFDWGAAAAFPFLPRVQCGRVVLALAQWRIDPADGELAPEPAEGFIAALEAWRSRWSVPRHVYLATGDNRLLLDLEDREQAELLRDELSHLAAGRSALVQEALPGPGEAWLPGPGGGHIAELVVPLTLRTGGDVAIDPAGVAAAAPVPDRVRMRTPGSDWLYLKLYGARTFEDELVAGPLRDFGRFALGAGLASGWFFIRYSDPHPHLRIRFHGEPATLIGPLMQQLCEWAGSLVADGPCTSFAFDTYDREVERYGGEAGIGVAEAVFMADSPAVAEMLRLRRSRNLEHDLTTLAVVSIDDLLDGIGLDEEARLALYSESAALGREDGKEFRTRQRELRQLLGSADALAAGPGGEALAAVLDARRAALTVAAEALAALGSDPGLSRTLPQLARSYIHLHANRLGRRVPEQRALQLLRRAREGLSRAPLR